MPSDTPRAAAADISTPSGKITRASAYALRQLDDALTLSGYAVSAGVQTSAGGPLSFADIGVIQSTAAKLGVFDPPGEGEAPSSSSVAASEWIDFEQAYYRLAVAMSPVTAETLASTQATAPASDGRLNLRDRILGYSPAQRFTRWFSFLASGVGAFVIVAECLIYVWGQEADASKFLWQKNLLESLVPWAYGALGSCAYLLRSAHIYIYQRSFDLRRKPEYLNRVLLGAISGGAIILFVNYLVDDGGTVLHLSSAALGFVAGYSTDFLFNAIERVVAAVFPKMDSDPKAQPQRVQKPKAPSAGPTGDGPSGASGDGDGADEDGNGDKQGKQRKTSKKAAKSSAHPDATGQSGDQD
jgi:hypothetical protein